MAPLIGRAVDKLHPWFTATLASFLLILVQAIQVGGAGLNVAVPIIVCFGIDVLRQTQSVSITTAVYGLEVGGRSRLNAVLMISVSILTWSTRRNDMESDIELVVKIFLGQVMGSSVGTQVFIKHGWRASALVSLAWCAFCFFVMLLRGPNVRRYTWFGWEGGFEVRKSKLATQETVAITAEEPASKCNEDVELSKTEKST